MSAVLGTWDLAIKTPIGTITAVYTFTHDADGIHGEARSKAETVPLANIVIEATADDAERVRWHQRVTKPMRLNLDFDVTVTDDTLSGLSRAGRLPRTHVVGRRIDS